MVEVAVTAVVPLLLFGLLVLTRLVERLLPASQANRDETAR